jgi:hypothetical protein
VVTASLTRLIDEYLEKIKESVARFSAAQEASSSEKKGT